MFLRDNQFLFAFEHQQNSKLNYNNNKMKYCYLTFHVICKTSFGQEVRISGNHPDLGAWDVSRSLVLKTIDNEYPRWKSLKKIRVSYKFNMEFKVLIFENNQLKRWENPIYGQNRYYTVYLKGVRLVIMTETPEIREEQRQKYNESQDSPGCGGSADKFDSDKLDSEKDRNSSSNDGPDDDFSDFSDFQPDPVFDLNYISNAFKEITSRLQIREAKTEIKVGNGQVVTTTKKVIHITQKSEIGVKCPQFSVNLQINSSISQRVIQLGRQIIGKVSPGECLLFRGFELCLVLKSIRKIIGSQYCYKLALYVSNLDSLKPLLVHIQKQFIVESLILSNALIFSSFELMNKTLDLIQSVGITLDIQFHAPGNYTLTIYDRPIVMKVLEEQRIDSVRTLQFFQIHPDCIIKKRIQNIRPTDESFRQSKIICFSFGPFESFSIIMDNKNIINKLCETHLVYVITPNKLSQHQRTISCFPKILFVSYLHLEMQYMNNKKVIEGISLFSSELSNQVKRLTYQYPLCTYKEWNNVIYVRNTNSSTIGINGFEQLAVDLQELINLTNRSNTPKQNKSLTLTRVNKSTIMIRQIFQTQIFFSKLLLQTTELRVDFVLLFLFNRFQNFSFLEQLKAVVSERYYNTCVLAYTLGYVKNRHCYNLFGEEFTEILEYLQKSVNSQQNKSKYKKVKGKFSFR